MVTYEATKLSPKCKYLLRYYHQLHLNNVKLIDVKCAPRVNPFDEMDLVVTLSRHSTEAKIMGRKYTPDPKLASYSSPSNLME